MATIRGRVDGARAYAKYSELEFLSGPPGPRSRQSSPRSFGPSSSPDGFCF